MALSPADLKNVAAAVKAGATREEAIKALALAKSLAKANAGTLTGRAATAIRSIGPAASSAAAVVKTGITSAGTSAAGVVGTGVTAARALASGVVSAGAASTVVAAVGVGLVAWTGVSASRLAYARATNGSVASNEEAYISGNEKMAAAQAKHMAQSGSKRKRSRSSDAHPRGNEAVALEPAEQAGTTPPADKTDAIEAAKRIASSPNPGNLIDNSNAAGSPAGPVAGAANPADAARANDQVNAEPKKLSPENGAKPPALAAGEKKESWWKKFVPENPKKKMQAGTFPALLGGVLAVMAGASTGGILLGVGAGFLIGAYLWGREND